MLCMDTQCVLCHEHHGWRHYSRVPFSLRCRSMFELTGPAPALPQCARMNGGVMSQTERSRNHFDRRARMLPISFNRGAQLR